MRKLMSMLDKATRQLINKARNLGSGGISVFLEDSDLMRICAVAAIDLDQGQLVSHIANADDLKNGYYGTPLEWFQQPVSTNVSFEETFVSLMQALNDFPAYFKVLCELHKRRLKFNLILETQPIPEIHQIVPRCLLEFGLKPSETLASWLVWRKWLYDIDNRSAQETGYLFEPILAAAIGGVSFAAANSPIKRADNPQKGRQVDCLDGKLAYEFKTRVTIAASGQGRFQEELDFARDCSQSGYTPMLLVLDDTPSSRLEALITEYSRAGGSAYTGNDAWNHVQEKAGKVMGKFVDKYVRTALQEVHSNYTILQPIHLANSATEIFVMVGNQRFSISRSL